MMGGEFTAGFVFNKELMTRVRWSAQALCALACSACMTEFDAALLQRDDAVASNSSGMLNTEVVPSQPVPDAVPPPSDNLPVATSGAAPQVTYGVIAQSCGTTLECPGASCCAQLEIPSGEFQMGTNTDAAAGSEEKPPHGTSVAVFFLDQFEVTVGRFRSYVEAYDGSLPPMGSGAHPRIPNSGWQLNYDAQMPTSKAALLDRINCDTGNYQTFTEAAGVREGMPMNCVDWHLAFAFCIWDGGRLPTEAEWEMAAAGGNEERLYAWGDLTPDPTLHAAMSCLADGEEGCANTDLLPVGQFPEGAARWGHLDLAGNLWEWTLDYYDATYYQSIGSCDNCSNLNGSTPRVIRGGNFTSLVTSLRATTRASYPPNTLVPYVGLRCARSAP